MRVALGTHLGVFIAEMRAYVCIRDKVITKESCLTNGSLVPHVERGLSLESCVLGSSVRHGFDVESGLRIAPMCDVSKEI